MKTENETTTDVDKATLDELRTLLGCVEVGKGGGLRISGTEAFFRDDLTELGQTLYDLMDSHLSNEEHIERLEGKIHAAKKLVSQAGQALNLRN